MSTGSVGRALLAGGLVSGLFAACAQGSQLTGAGGGGVGGTTSPAGSTTGTGMMEAGPPGTIGSPCATDADCVQGTCTPIGPASYCSTPCPPACPYGSYCSVIDGSPICVPDFYQECDKCNGAADCKLPSDNCLQAPLGDKFCARDCSVDGVCPNGFTCEDSVTYESPADAGTDAGKDAGGDAGDAGGDGGPAVYAPRWCVPNSGYSCPCNEQRDGVTHACTKTTPAGTCGGMETCDGKSMMWKGCTATTPTSELCNGKDDDCDGVVDNGDGNALCATAGPKPPHASWTCKDATCSVGACDPGWTSYPGGGDPATGCACQLEAGEPNGACAMATPAGMVTDVGGSPLTILGTLSSGNDVDVWSFDAVDVNEMTTNSYHVNLAFTAPMPNDEFVMDVMRGGPCSDTPSGPFTSITAYDWCVNGNDGATPPTGEVPCAQEGAVHCGGLLNDSMSMSHTATYFVRVHRKPGATATCTTYKIAVTAQGGACDFTKKCP
jgi:hypothetical protein